MGFRSSTASDKGPPPGAGLHPEDEVVTRGTDVAVNAFYKHSHIHQHPHGTAAPGHRDRDQLPDDLQRLRRLHTPDELPIRARAVNRRLLDTERAGQGCGESSFERTAMPTVDADGRRSSPARRFGDPRVMALLSALCAP